jgi:hypothetical protein
VRDWPHLSQLNVMSMRLPARQTSAPVRHEQARNLAEG